MKYGLFNCSRKDDCYFLKPRLLSEWSDNENKAKSGWSVENYFSFTNIIKRGGMNTIVFHIYIGGLLLLTDNQKHT